MVLQQLGGVRPAPDVDRALIDQRLGVVDVHRLTGQLGLAGAPPQLAVMGSRQMQLANTLCRLREHGRTSVTDASTLQRTSDNVLHRLPELPGPEDRDALV